MTTCGITTALLALTCTLTPALGVVQLPLEVTSPDAAPVTKSVSVDLPAGGSPASLYLRIHNLRFGGQVSVRLNGGSWVNLYNHTVSIAPNEMTQGGIGGINTTIAFTIPLTAGQALAGQSNTVSVRLNGTNGIVSAVRLIDVDFLTSAGARLLPVGEVTLEDPNAWQPPSGSPTDIAAGASLWENATLVENPIETNPMRAKCASCHFDDGSDLKYFNYSNETIITRSRFHGLSQQQGEQIASYIRSSTKPNPGRPWNPPFQPGPGLDPVSGDSPATVLQKVRGWMAGAGLQAVLSSDSAILPYVFPEGTSRAAIAKVIDHTGNFSVRQIPVQFQFPDWNAWLPHYAPEDAWPSSTDYNAPYALLNTLRTTLGNAANVDSLAAQGKLISTFDAFNKGLEDWYGQFRLLTPDIANETAVSLRKTPGLTREDVIKGLVHWMVIKILHNVRTYDIEGKHDSVTAMQAKGHPRFTPDPLLMPGNVKLSSVFSFAPHIISDNWDNFANQPEWIGKMESDQWYHLSLCMNSGSRMITNQNVPLDWDYQLQHVQDASLRTGLPYGFQRLITQIKMYQSRDNGSGVKISGFTPRTLSPWTLYSDEWRDRSLFKGALDAAEPDLWRKTFEQFLYEQLDVMEAMDLNDASLVPRRAVDANGVLEPDVRHHLESAGYTPVAWPGGSSNKYFVHPDEVYADLLYRLLPLLPKEGVDVMLLQDLREWCKRVWPLGNWDGLFSTNVLYAENFEDGVSDFASLATVTAIKDANYVNTYAIGPRNGGGAYVAQRTLTANAVRTGTRDGTIPVSGITRLNLKARTAFKDDDGTDPGVVTFKVQVRFNNSATVYNAEDELTLDPELYDKQFLSYESTLAVPAGATSINRLVVSWQRAGGTGGGVVYIDNIHVLAVDETPDTTVPSAPVMANVSANGNILLRSHWTYTNAVSNGVVGYNVYRWIDGQPTSSRIKINTGLVDNPYLDFDDYTIRAGTTYRYDVTAVDAVGNESPHSNSRTKSLTDTSAPITPSPLWAESNTGSLHLGWFSGNDWDIAGYDVYRKASNEPGFTMLTTVAAPAEALFFTDPTALEGLNYNYYVRAFDLLGNQTPPSSTVSILAQTGVTYVGLWKKQFQGTNGWDTANTQLTGDTVDFDRDGVANLWEYVRGTNPAQVEANAAAFVSVARSNVSGTFYLQLTYERQEDLPAGVKIKVQFSNDLQTWPLQEVVEGGPVGAGITVNTDAPVNGRRTIRVRQNVPLDAGAYHFMRLSAEQTPP